MNEAYPLEKAEEADDRMMSGKARFRVVLTMGRKFPCPAIIFHESLLESVDWRDLRSWSHPRSMRRRRR
jgi:hypothetical protein